MKYDIQTFFEWPISAKGVVIAVVCAIVFFVGYLWDIVPLKTQLANKQQEELDLKAQFESTFSRQEVIKSEVAQFPKLKEKLAEWNKKFIPAKELSVLLNEILKIGAANQLQFDLFSPGIAVVEGNYLKVPIKVIVTGNYHLLASFLSQIANLPSMVVIQDFAITNETTAAKSTETPVTTDLLKAAFTLDIYYFQETKP